MKKEKGFLALFSLLSAVIIADVGYIVYVVLKIKNFLSGVEFVQNSFKEISTAAVIVNGVALGLIALYLILRKLYYSYFKRK